MLFVARTGLGFQFQTLGSVSPEVVESLAINLVMSWPKGIALAAVFNAAFRWRQRVTQA